MSVQHPARTRAATSPVVFVLLLIVVAMVGAGCGPMRQEVTPPGARPSVVVIAIDAMRADHLGAAGNDAVLTPNLDLLARDGVLFAAAQSTAPWTLPSVASVFTGVLPARHGAVGGDRAWLDDRNETMAERFLAAGYRTGGFVAVDWLTASCNMDQGFQPWQGPLPPQGLSRAENQTWLARAFIDWNRMRPFFLFLHYFDAHTPYTPPPPFDGMYHVGDPFAPGEPILTMLTSPANRAPNRDGGMYDFLADVTDLAYPINQYAAGVSYVDMHVGQVIARLKMLDLYDDTLIVVLADHGEHLGEHGIWFAHYLPYEEALRVPLIVKLPRGRHAGAVVDEPVSLLDVLPTVLAAAGLPAPALVDGRDLGPLMAGREGGRSLLAAEQGSDLARSTRTLRDGRWKLHVIREDGAVRHELYDLAADPGELDDLAAAQPEQVARLREAMGQLWDPARLVQDDGRRRPRVLDESAARRLRSLGY